MYFFPFWVLININMRCIEMQFIDVFMEKVKLININMRCIEMKEGAEIMRDWIKININMRCIEIFLRKMDKAKQL